MQKIELISYDFCPFIQPAVITLLEKNIPFKMTYLEPGNKPEWYSELVPSGQTPALRVGDKVLLESAVINEYLDEVTPSVLHPQDPYIKADNRNWIAFSYKILDAIYDTKMAKTEATFKHERSILVVLLRKLEQKANNNNFFNGDNFNLIDTAYAPVFRTLVFLDKSYDTKILKYTPGLARWSANLLSRRSVQASVTDSYDNTFHDRLCDSQSILKKRL